MKTSKKSLKIRLLTTVTLLLAAIFTLIYLVFNFFFTQYIETAATFAAFRSETRLHRASLRRGQKIGTGARSIGWDPCG